MLCHGIYHLQFGFIETLNYYTAREGKVVPDCLEILEKRELSCPLDCLVCNIVTVLTTLLWLLRKQKDNVVHSKYQCKLLK